MKFSFKFFLSNMRGLQFVHHVNSRVKAPLFANLSLVISGAILVVLFGISQTANSQAQVLAGPALRTLTWVLAGIGLAADLDQLGGSGSSQRDGAPAYSIDTLIAKQRLSIYQGSINNSIIDVNKALVSDSIVVLLDLDQAVVLRNVNFDSSAFSGNILVISSSTIGQADFAQAVEMYGNHVIRSSINANVIYFHGARANNVKVRQTLEIFGGTISDSVLSANTLKVIRKR
jgi:hypothetical protein